MAITTEEQIDLYRARKHQLGQIERDIEQLQNKGDLAGTLTSDVRSFELWVYNLEEHEAREIVDRVLVMLEDKHEHASAKLEEMLR